MPNLQHLAILLPFYGDDGQPPKWVKGVPGYMPPDTRSNPYRCQIRGCTNTGYDRCDTCHRRVCNYHRMEYYRIDGVEHTHDWSRAATKGPPEELNMCDECADMGPIFRWLFYDGVWFLQGLLGLLTLWVAGFLVIDYISDRERFDLMQSSIRSFASLVSTASSRTGDTEFAMDAVP